MKMKITRSSGSVFRDLGFSWEEAEHLKVRAVLRLHVQEIVRSRRLRETKAAGILGVTQPRVSDLLRSDCFQRHLSTAPPRTRSAFAVDT